MKEKSNKRRKRRKTNHQWENDWNEGIKKKKFKWRRKEGLPQVYKIILPFFCNVAL